MLIFVCGRSGSGHGDDPTRWPGSSRTVRRVSAWGSGDRSGQRGEAGERGGEVIDHRAWHARPRTVASARARYAGDTPLVGYAGRLV